MTHNDTIILLQYILPIICVGKPFSSIETAVHFYLDDLSGFKDSVIAELDLWTCKWNTVEISSRPVTLMDALSLCDKMV